MYHCDDVLIQWWVRIFEICFRYHFFTIKIHIILSFRVSISYGVWDISIYVIFHTFKNVYVITPSNVWKNSQDSNLIEPGQKYPHMQKISPEGLPVSSINSVHWKYIYSGTSLNDHLRLTTTPILRPLFKVPFHYSLTVVLINSE